MTDPAPGFERHFKQSAFTDPWEPLFSQTLEDQVRIGVVLHERHCNSRGFVHGAFLTAIADNATGLSCGVMLRASGFEVGSLVTSHVAIDFIGRAQLGEWLATDTSVVKVGKRQCVANCLLSTANGHIARVNATFQNLT